jgi:dipeptidyl aminopeptidase/acylaminoacyl peptidase
MNIFRAALFSLVFALPACVEANDLTNSIGELRQTIAHLDAKLSRQINELMWSERLSEIARVDHVRFTGPPPVGTNGTPAVGGSNEVVLSAMTFIPRKHGKHMPLIVLVHGEIHGNIVSDEDSHVVRELIEEGYGVIAPDYRGSSGYGADFWKLIDYGGLEVDDVEAARKFALERYPELDARRVGIMGWSHGGLIALLTVFANPEVYQACYAGVPVSDLEERIRIRGKEYEQLLAIPPVGHKEVVEEYHRRSPAWNAQKLKTPLLIHANTNDEDVTWREIQKLITALQAADKQFQYTVYTNAPGGHFFNRLDTKPARESRQEIWKFMRSYLRP